MATGGVDESVIQHALRVTDIIGEPLEYLSAISGLAQTPLVSLEEAVRPLESIVADVELQAYMALQKSQIPADGLTQNESASIRLYTMEWEPSDKCLYKVLNKTLRSKGQDRIAQLKPWHLYLRLFLCALFRLPPIRATVYRGVKEDMRERYHKGKKNVWWAFSSSTTSIGVLNLFLGKTGPRTMFHIECLSGRDIRNHSDLPHENELLLPPALEFQITDHLDQDELQIFQLKETRLLMSIPPTVPMVTPPSHNPVPTGN